MLLTGLFGFQTYWLWSCKGKQESRPRESNQMASQKLRKTSTVSWKNMNQYILTRIKYALDGPFGPSKTVFLLMSNLFIFVCLGVMIRLPMTLSFWGHLATQLKSYDSINSVWYGLFLSSQINKKKQNIIETFKSELLVLYILCHLTHVLGCFLDINIARFTLSDSFAYRFLFRLKI